MSVSPVATGIPRRGRGTEPAEGVGPVPVADWDEVAHAYGFPTQVQVQPTHRTFAQPS